MKSTRVPIRAPAFGPETKIRALRQEIARLEGLASLGEAVAWVAHEIKNPLAAIIAPLEVLRDRPGADGDQAEILDQVIAEVKRLDGLVRRLLSLARPWNPKKETCNLGEVIRRVSELCRSEAIFSEVSVHLDPATDVLAPVDPALFEQVLWNLFQNAAEALRGKGAISIGCCRTSDRTVRLEVCDEGPGIPPEIQSKLFKPFCTTKPGGSGLGLCISRRIMEAHGGSMNISSTLGRGTQIFLELPLDGR